MTSSSIAPALRRLGIRDQRGSILIMTALVMTALLTMTAFTINASYMYQKRNRLHAAADAAAKTAAIEAFFNGASQGTMEAFADEQVTAHGFSPARNGGTATVTITKPAPGWGATYVRADVSEPTATFFGSLAKFTSLTPAAYAVAGASSSANCLVALNGMAVGNANLIMPGCGIANGGAMTNHNVANIVAASISTGTCTGGSCGSATTGMPPPSDPLAGRYTAPTNPGGCTSASIGQNATLTLTAGCYSSITMGNSAELRLGTGVYYLTGPFVTGNTPRICLNATCTFDYNAGVMIYLAAGASFNLPNGSFVRLNAMTTAPYSGMLMWQEAGNTNPITINNGNGTFDLSGAVYAPSASVEWNNTGATNTCSLIVANTLTWGNGNATLSNTCAQYGGSPLMTISLAE